MPHMTEVLAARQVVKFNNRKFTPLYKPAGPLRLRNQVTDRKDRQSGEPCLEQVNLLMSCWKRNDFNENLCSKELENYMKCRAIAAEKLKQKRALNESGFEGQTKGHISSQQINKLMRRHPQTQEKS